MNTPRIKNSSRNLSRTALAALALSLPSTACIPELFISADCYTETLADQAPSWAYNDHNPAECYDPDNRTALLEGVRVSAPAAYHPDIAQHIRFLRRFSGQELVDRYLRQIVTVNNELITQDTSFDPEVCQFSEPETIYINTESYLLDITLPKKSASAVIPYTTNFFGNLESSISSFVANLLFKKLYDHNHCLEGMAEEWKKQGLTQPEYVYNGTIVRNLFEEKYPFDYALATLYAEFSQYAFF